MFCLSSKYNWWSQKSSSKASKWKKYKYESSRSTNVVCLVNKIDGVKSLQIYPSIPKTIATKLVEEDSGDSQPKWTISINSYKIFS